MNLLSLYGLQAVPLETLPITGFSPKETITFASLFSQNFFEIDESIFPSQGPSTSCVLGAKNHKSLVGPNAEDRPVDVSGSPQKGGV